MYELPPFDPPFTDFIPEANIDMPVVPPNSTAESHANPLQGYAMTPTQGSGIDWSNPVHFGGLVTTSKK
ncbi:hypothetical protein OG21DRAFT_1508283 [Imleria badia]|nr:hypothetical protein OG21DRAFT_1508283 [Imleria badia]